MGARYAFVVAALVLLAACVSKEDQIKECREKIDKIRVDAEAARDEKLAAAKSFQDANAVNKGTGMGADDMEKLIEVKRARDNYTSAGSKLDRLMGQWGAEVGNIPDVEARKQAAKEQKAFKDDADAKQSAVLSGAR